MLDYEIKALEWQLLDYQEWINHVRTCGNFTNPDEVITNKIKSCLGKMINGYEFVNGILSGTDEEKVNLITSQEGYKKRSEREITEVL